MATSCSESRLPADDWTSVRNRSGLTRGSGEPRGSAGTSGEKNQVGRKTLPSDSSVQDLIGAPITWRSGPPLSNTYFRWNGNERKSVSTSGGLFKAGHHSSLAAPSSDRLSSSSSVSFKTPSARTEDLGIMNTQDWPSVCSTNPASMLTPAANPTRESGNGNWSDAVKNPVQHKKESESRDHFVANGNDGVVLEKDKGAKKKKKKSKDNDILVKREPLMLELDTIFQTLELKQTKKVLVGAGATPLVVQQQPKRPTREEHLGRGNALDASAPLVRRGKEKEQPKKKKPTALRRVIIKEKEERKKLQTSQTVNVSLQAPGKADSHIQSSSGAGETINFSKDLLPYPEELIKTGHIDQVQQLSEPVDQVQQDQIQDLIQRGQTKQELVASEEVLDDHNLKLPYPEVTFPLQHLTPPIASVLPTPTALPASATPPIAMPTPPDTSMEEQISMRGNFSWSVALGTKQIHNKRFREYCNHLVTEDINVCVEKLLDSLMKFQDRQFQKDAIKARAKKRYVCGLREVFKHLMLRRLKCVIVPPNLDRVESQGGIYDYVDKIIQSCVEQGVLLVFALSRRRLATILHKKQKIGSVGIFYYDGAEAQFKELVKLVGVARESYKASLEEKEECHDPVLSTLLPDQPLPNTAHDAGCVTEGVVSTSAPLGHNESSMLSPHYLNIHADVFTPRHLNIQAPEFISHQ